MDMKISLATVLSWVRARSSAVGNPSYDFTITDENGLVYSGRTRSNCSFLYGLRSHPETLKNVVLRTTASGRVYMDNAD